MTPTQQALALDALHEARGWFSVSGPLAKKLDAAIASLEAAPAAPADADAASLMVLTGVAWLKENAPHRLSAAPAAPADETTMADGEVKGDAREVRQMLVDCEHYLKEGETPAQRIERERRDTEAVLNLLIREKQKTERMADLLHRMLEAPTTQIGVTWKDAIRQALAAPAAPEICSIGQCTMEKCNDTGRCERHYGAAPAAVAEPAEPKREPSPAVAAKIAANQWDNINDVMPTIRAARAGKWAWFSNMRCKYIELRIDMRDGGCILRDRDRVRIDPSEFAHQSFEVENEPWQTATPPPTEPSAEVVLPEPVQFEHREPRERYTADQMRAYGDARAAAAILADRAARGVNHG